MTAKSKRKHTKGALKTATKESPNASAKAISQGTLDESAQAISQSEHDAVAETVRQGTPGVSAERMSSARANAGELNEKVLTQGAKFNAQWSMPLQNIFQEWFGFADMRMRQHMHLAQSIQNCRSLPDLHQAYTQFWQNTLTQYGEETRRMLQITQGVVDDASHVADGIGNTKATLH
jgi:Phasin protein